RMPKKRSWTDEELKIAVRDSRGYRMVLQKLNLIPAGGNYVQIRHRIIDLRIDTTHFKGMRWNKGLTYHRKSRPAIDTLLINGSRVQSFKLKKRLFEEGIKNPACELCGWCKKSSDGRIPVELEHINGNKLDNR